jgi:hypothetical protein
MFTGIVEAMGSLVRKEAKGTNVEFWFTSPFTQELKVDQSLAHNARVQGKPRRDSPVSSSSSIARHLLGTAGASLQV